MTTPTTEIETLRTAFAAEIETAETRGWTRAQFRKVVDAMVAEKTPAGWTRAAADAQVALSKANRTGVLPAALEGEVTLVAVDLFFRAWNRDAVKRYSDANKREARIFLPAGSSLTAIISASRLAGVAVGATDTGVYEVQSDLGIWKHYHGRRINLQDVGTARVVFATWDAMEAAELRGEDLFASVVEAAA